MGATAFGQEIHAWNCGWLTSLHFCVYVSICFCSLFWRNPQVYKIPKVHLRGETCLEHLQPRKSLSES